MRALAAGLVLIAVLPAPGAAQESVRPAAAYFRGGEVCFEPFRPVAWDALARRHFSAFDPARPPREAVRAHWNGIGRLASFDFEAPVPAALGRDHHYALAERGVAALRLTRLHGVIVYESDAGATTVGPPRVSGRACGVAADGPALGDAGFVLVSAATLSPRVLPVAVGAAPRLPAITARAEAGAVVYTYREGTRVEDFARRRAADPAVRAAWVLEPGGRGARMLFVRWRPDPLCHAGCCEHAYSLYALAAAIAPVLENAYDCDV